MPDRASRPTEFPEQLTHGAYTATFTGIQERFPDDPLASAQWDIKRDGKVVGMMWVSDSYGWDRPSFSMTKLVWAGPWPQGASDPKSPDYGMCFDGTAYTSYAEALAEFAKRADRLIAWRKERGGRS